jgi:uncharacterized protein YndB with AHSA1/START domain/predicted enzyme related to lactoylglutathione lyase
MLAGLRTVVYAVLELERAKEWYAALLGTRPYFDEPFYVGFEVGGYELGLQPAGENEPGVGGDIAFWAVDDVERAIARAIELGAKPKSAAQEVGGGIVVGSVIDPFGNVLGLIRNPHFAPPLTDAKAGNVSKRAIVKEALVAASPEQAWSRWSSSEGIAKWWVKESRIELSPGGFFELYFLDDAPPGSRGSDGCRILSYLPGRMLSFTWNSPPHLPTTRQRHTWVVLEFSPEGEKTRVRLSQIGWPESGWDAAEWQATYDYFDAAWSRVLEQFARHFSAGSAP